MFVSLNGPEYYIVVRGATNTGIFFSFFEEAGEAKTGRSCLEVRDIVIMDNLSSHHYEWGAILDEWFNIVNSLLVRLHDRFIKNPRLVSLFCYWICTFITKLLCSHGKPENFESTWTKHVGMSPKTLSISRHNRRRFIGQKWHIPDKTVNVWKVKLRAKFIKLQGWTQMVVSWFASSRP